MTATAATSALERTVGEIMSADLVMKPVTTVTKETTIRDAARTIVERDIECLLVMDSNRLAGLFFADGFASGTGLTIKRQGG